MNELRFGIIGTGYYARYQLAAWCEMPGVRCVALYNRTRAKAETLAREFGVPAVCDQADELIRQEKPDFIDIITDVDTHILDTARILFGEAATLFCRTARVNPGIRGEDVAKGTRSRGLVHGARRRLA